VADEMAGLHALSGELATAGHGGSFRSMIPCVPAAPSARRWQQRVKTTARRDADAPSLDFGRL
jgi:hypothetical protein